MALIIVDAKFTATSHAWGKIWRRWAIRPPTQMGKTLSFGMAGRGKKI